VAATAFAHLVLDGFAAMLASGVVSFKAVITHVGGLVKPSQTVTSMVVMVDVNNNNLLFLWIKRREGDGFISTAGIDTDQTILW